MTEFFKKIGTAEIRNVLAVIIVVGIFVLLYLMTMKEIPKGNEGILNTAIGFVFGGALGGVIGYFFGDKKDNDSKSKPDQPTP